MENRFECNINLAKWYSMVRFFKFFIQAKGSNILREQSNFQFSLQLNDHFVGWIHAACHVLIIQILIYK